MTHHTPKTSAPKARHLPMPGACCAWLLLVLFGVTAFAEETEQVEQAPPVIFCDVEETDVHKIVFLIDASGSLLDTFPFVLLELKKSIFSLNDQQLFAVIFFQSDDVIEVPPVGLKAADAEAKEAVIDWLNTEGSIIPRGRANPIAALRLALSYKPDAMFLLSDNITGKKENAIDADVLLDVIAEANTADTRINTIQYIYPDTHDPSVLQQIAEQNKGEYRFFDFKELAEDEE